ncbi:MAG: tetratricopeptide repeat protein [Cyanobacteria bacterium P01_A01_bin.123]
MVTTSDWQLQMNQVTHLQAQDNHSEAEALCKQLLADLPPTPVGWVLQVKLQSHLITSLEAQARYGEAQTQLQAAQLALNEIKANYPAKISLPLELKLSSQQGTLARIQGHYPQAEQVFQQVIQLVEDQGLRHQPIWIRLLNDLAIVYKYWGKFEAAEDLYQTALAALIERHGEQHIEVATIYHNLGGLNHSRRHYVEAEPYARKSYQLHVDLLGADHAKTIADAAALGSILHGLEQYDDAIAYFEAAIAFFEQQFGPIHYEIAINLNNLAASLQAKGELESAEQAYRRALELKETLLGSEHPDVAISLNNLASLLQKMDRSTEAGELFERAIACFEATVGPEHPNTQLCRNNAARQS